MKITIEVPTTEIKKFLKERLDLVVQDRDLEGFIEEDIQIMYCDTIRNSLPDSLQDTLIEYFTDFT